MENRFWHGAVLCGLVMIASPAQAQLTVDLGGWFKGYGFWTDQDSISSVFGPGFGQPRDFDIIRSTEVHVGGETTLDNGLTVGAHLEMEADASGPDDSFDVQESYVYGSGGWGRVNFGAEDGAAYLLQVEAPSADSNIDGIRQYVNPVNYQLFSGAPTILQFFLSTNPVGGTVNGGLDYDHDITLYADKITYLSPILNGFQLGLSYTPDVADASTEDALNFDDVDGALGDGWEAAARYEGMFNNVGIILGVGYSHINLENNATTGVPFDPEDDRTAWNAGVDFDIGPFGVGAAYMEDDFGEPFGVPGPEVTKVVGADYTTGPFKIGASYLDIDDAAGFLDLSGAGIEGSRWTGGVIYTYGPGMTLRGSVSRLRFDDVNIGLGPADFEATSVLVGTQINF